MSAPPAGPRKRRLEELAQQVYAVAERLGIPEDGVDRTIARAGGPREALRRLLERERRRANGVLRGAERAELEEEAAKRRDVYERERPRHQAEREFRRRLLTLGQRLDQALHAISTLPAARVASPEPSVSSGGPEHQAPPHAETLEVSSNLAIISHHVGELERMLDVAQGLADPTAYRLMSNAQKDRMILENFAGVHSEQLSDDVPELGSARTIERIRRREGLRPSNGLPRQDSDIDSRATLSSAG